MSVMSLVSTGPLLLAIPVAAAAGAVTFLSPCCLPLVPGYLAYITGMSGADATADATATGTAASESAAETEAGGGVTTRARAKPAAPAARRTGRTVAGTALFVAGFSAVFALTGLAVGGLGQLFSAHDSLLTRILGVVTIVLGLLFFGAFDRFMFAGRVFKPSVMPKAGLAGAPLLGVLFGIGWTPCIGPTLTAVLALSASSGTAARGAFLAFIYGLGLGIPFLIVAVAFQRVVGVLNFFKRNARMVTRVGGVLLVVVGLLEATGAWTTAITWLHTHWFNGYQLPLLGARFSAVTALVPILPNGSGLRVSAPYSPYGPGRRYRRAPAFGFTATGLRGACASGRCAGRGSPAASTNAASRRESSPSSGCQWIPTPKRCPSTSSASVTSPSGDQPVTVSPSPRW